MGQEGLDFCWKIAPDTVVTGFISLQLDVQILMEFNSIPSAL